MGAGGMSLGLVTGTTFAEDSSLAPSIIHVKHLMSPVIPAPADQCLLPQQVPICTYMIKNNKTSPII